MSQPLQQPEQQPPQQQQQQPPAQQPEQQRAPVVVHAPNNDGQVTAQLAAFFNDMKTTLQGLPEQLANSVREVTPQHQQPPAQQPPAQQTAQQTQTQQHTQQPPAQQPSTGKEPFRTRLQRAWFGVQ